jgi:hypothetical protein
MQARSRASPGTFASNSALKSSCVHQQGGCAWPVDLATSIAHWLDCPHSGHTVGSTVADFTLTRAV